MIKLFVDDLRISSQVYYDDEVWITKRNYEEAATYIQDYWNEIGEISLDHDLGSLSKTGYELACLIEEICEADEYNHIPILRCHSMNPVGRAKIKRVFESIKRRQET